MQAKGRGQAKGRAGREGMASADGRGGRGEGKIVRGGGSIVVLPVERGRIGSDACENRIVGGGNKFDDEKNTYDKFTKGNPNVVRDAVFTSRTITVTTSPLETREKNKPQEILSRKRIKG